jgi:hypothetical protein
METPGRKKPDLILRTIEDVQISIESLKGFVVVIAFLSKAACHTGPTLEILDEIYLDIGHTKVRCLGCIVDLESDEDLREYHPFAIPIGAASRRAVADFLNVPISGFYLPQFVIIDKDGKHRLRCLPSGDDFWQAIKNLRFPVDTVINEIEKPDDSSQRGAELVETPGVVSA